LGVKRESLAGRAGVLDFCRANSEAGRIARQWLTLFKL
jgi:hypothetical protein